MKSRDILGYLIGLAVFIILIPLIMWKVSGDVHPGTVQIVICIMLATVGIGLLILFRSAKAAAVFVLFFAVMMVQVSSEEKRLEQDFGEEYREYKKTTKKLIPYIW